MKKVLFLFISLFLIQLILGNEIANDTELKEKTCNANLSVGLVNGGSIGYGKIKYREKSTTEFTINLHYHTCHYFYNTGIYSQTNVFRNKQRRGFFYLVAGGFDYTKGETPLFSYGGSTDDTDTYEGFFPNITAGLGYSFPINKHVSWRIYWDIGLKKSISNLNFSVNF